MLRTILFALLTTALLSCSDSGEPVAPPPPSGALVTFIEIGATTCEDCVAMQPVMVSLAERYGSEQLSVQFIDVFINPNAAKPYKIYKMPTQVFLDKDGKEFHRHEGFYPEASIDSLLATRGLAPL